MGAPQAVIPLETTAYDVVFKFESGKGLPIGDFRTSDPYLVVTFGGVVRFKTHHVIGTLDPVWDDEIKVVNLPRGAHVRVLVYDKDRFSHDDLLGQASFTFNPEECPWHRDLPVIQPNGKEKGAVTISVDQPQPSSAPARPVLLAGPVKHKRHICILSGMLTAPLRSTHFTYRLSLLNVDHAFEGKKQPWNRDHPEARAIFGSSDRRANAARAGLRAQYTAMYQTNHGTQCGKCHSAQDFFELLAYARLQGIQRYYTYVLMEDGMRFSETGAAFFRDVLSKHAMHACAGEEVYYAGEFTIEPSNDPNNKLGYKLCIDNNSGTYAPPADRLHMVQRLFVSNFPDMEVEALDREDPRVQLYHSHCPRR